VIQLVPPLTITRDEVKEGLGIIDEVLVLADEFAFS
jgi:4-aminobutyrate aminotransferase-like enzyme